MNNVNKRVVSFVKLLSERDINSIQESVNFNYVNIFRYLDHENKWTYGGYDSFEFKEECDKWAKEYLKYQENSPAEICANLTIQQILEAWQYIDIN